jgi:hypothetical protein
MADLSVSIPKETIEALRQKKLQAESEAHTISLSNPAPSPSISDLVVLLRSYNYDAWPISEKIRLRNVLTKALEKKRLLDLQVANENLQKPNS